MNELKFLLSTLNDLLNKYGGTIGAASLVFSIWVWFRTGNIEKNIIKSREFRTYKDEKREILTQLMSLIDSVTKDNLMDEGIRVAILRYVNKLKKCKGFISFEARYHIFWINHYLKDSMPQSSHQLHVLVRHMGKLVGILEIDPVSRDVEGENG